jgi:hypothetical protein
MAKKKKTNAQPASEKNKILAQVPADAIFVIRTKLDPKTLRAAAAMGTSSVMRLFYMVCGIAVGIAAMVCRFTLHTSTLTTVLVLLMALMIIWQGNRLPLENARRMSLELEKASKQYGVDATDRVCFATARSFGCLMPNGSIKLWDWNEFDTYKGNFGLMILGLKGKGEASFVLDMQGFLKGQPGNFLSFLSTHIAAKKQNKFEQTADKICYTLDNWTQIQKKDKEAKDAEKAAKKAAKATKDKDAL